MDRPETVSDPEITPDMLRAGLRVWENWDQAEDEEACLLAAIFWAMHTHRKAPAEQIRAPRPTESVTAVSPVAYPFQPQPNTHVSTASSSGPRAEPRNFFLK